jgi:molecular chaperone HscB
MSYFELYNEPFHLIINKAELKRKYYALSMQFHPDKMVQASAAEQAEAVKKSEDVNKGYTILQDFGKRLQLCLQHMNLVDELNPPALSKMFLLEMMDLNEEIEEAKANRENIEALSNKIESLENDLKDQILFTATMEDLNNCSDAQKKDLVQYYYEQKYLRRLKDLLHNREVEM